MRIFTSNTYYVVVTTHASRGDRVCLRGKILCYNDALASTGYWPDTFIHEKQIFKRVYECAPFDTAKILELLIDQSEQRDFGFFRPDWPIKQFKTFVTLNGTHSIRYNFFNDASTSHVHKKCSTNIRMIFVLVRLGSVNICHNANCDNIFSKYLYTDAIR